jgi:hypothetical protein
MLPRQISATLRRLVGRHHPDPDEGFSFFFQNARGDGRGANVTKRWQEIPILADLRMSDTLLDVGCAEGLVALEAAGLVHHVHGIESVEHRVVAARRFAIARSVANVSFATGSIVTDELPQQSYDVVLFLGVYGYPVNDRRIGAAELGKVLGAARRQVVLRVDVQDHPDALRYLDEIHSCFDRHGFDGICFPKVAPDVGNIILGNRRDSGARIRYLPPLILLPTGTGADLPILRGQRDYETDPAIWGQLLGHYPASGCS